MIMWSRRQRTDLTGECCSFMDAIEIWIQKPHVVNRFLCGAKIISQCEGNNTHDVLENIKTSQLVEVDDDLLRRLENILKEMVNEDPGVLRIVLRDLIPKNIQRYPVLREIVVIDEASKETYFIPHELTSPSGNNCSVSDDRGYKIKLENNSRITLDTRGSEESYIEESLGYTLPWLETTLLSKLAAWSVTRGLNTEVSTLKLVPVDKYNTLYQHLKKKYGAPLVEVWPESTDPQKFVYEDVAIATYLLLLWEEDRELKGLTEKQSFVDLGCGNGLLVYILTSEGHRGLGLDIRKRKIWDFFGEKFNLQEREIIPSDETIFPDYDWLIGNHSDELTPWIPVMAARSSYSCCYFVLPCCLFDFSAKFSEKSRGTSQYRTYLDYVQQVGVECGFNVQEDSLRIPSTKKICFIGRTRTYKSEEETEMDTKRQSFINHRCSLASRDKNTEGSSNEDCEVTENDTSSSNLKRKSSKWSEDFQAREYNQKTHNCITVDSDIKDRINREVFEKLLGMEECVLVKTEEDTEWNRGGSLPLGDVARMFDQTTLQKLKCECGGLQTLLRNSHHIFRVQGGAVQLRDWTTDDYDQHQKTKRRKKGKPVAQNPEKNKKTKLCYFHKNHPQGCPMSSQLCRFAHGDSELLKFVKE